MSVQTWSFLAGRTPVTTEAGLASSCRSFLVVLLVAVALLPWVYEYLPSQDGATHLAIARIASDLLSGAKSMNGDFYEQRPHFYTNLGTEIVAIPLLQLVSAVTVEKIMFAVVSLGLPLGIIACMFAVARRYSPFMLLALPYGYTTTLASGNFNFLFGILIGFFILAGILAEHRSPSRARMAAYAAAWLLLALVHPAAAVVMLTTAGLLVLLRFAPWERDRRLAIRYTAVHGLTVLPCMGLLATFFLFSVPSDMEYQRSLYLRLREFVLQYEVYKLGRAEIALAFAMSCTIAASVAAAIVRRGRPRWEHSDSLLVAAAVWFGIYLVAPNKMSGGDAFVSRIEILPWIFALIWVSAQEMSFRWCRAVLVGGVAIQTCFLLEAFWTHKAVSDDMKGYFEMASAIPRNSVVVPVVGDQRAMRPSGEPVSMKGQPFQHIHNYVAVSRDAVFLENWNAHYRVANIRFRADADPYPLLWSGHLAEGIVAIEHRTDARPLFILAWRVPKDGIIWTELASLVGRDFEPVLVHDGSTISGVFRLRATLP